MSDQILKATLAQAKMLEESEAREPIVPVARYTSNAGYSLPSGGTYVMNYEDVGFDPFNLVTIGSNWKFTAPVGGYYLVEASLSLVGSTAWALGEFFILSLYINGGTAIHALHRTNTLTSGSEAFGAGSTIVHLDAGDYLDIRVYQNSGSNIAISGTYGNNHVSIVKVA